MSILLRFLSLLVPLAYLVSAASPPLQPNTNDLNWPAFLLNTLDLNSPIASALANSNASTNFLATMPMGTITCASNPAPPARPVVQPIVVDDYLELLEKLVLPDQAMEPRDWTFTPERRAYTWHSRSCRFGFKGPQGRSAGLIQPILFAHLAARIAEACVKEETRFLGGGLRFGPGFEFRAFLVAPAGAGARG